MNRPRITLWGRRVAVLGIGLLAVLAGIQGWILSTARMATAEQLLEQLSAAAEEYREDYAVYPPDEETGVQTLAAYLPRKRSRIWMPPMQDILSQGKPLPRNPVWPDEPGHKGVVFYRNPGVHNLGRIDLWCADADGRPDGINNWD